MVNKDASCSGLVGILSGPSDALAGPFDLSSKDIPICSATMLNKSDGKRDLPKKAKDTNVHVLCSKLVNSSPKEGGSSSTSSPFSPGYFLTLSKCASLKFSNEGGILKNSKDPDRDYMEKIHPEKMRLSLEYAKKSSIKEDLKIIIRTLFILLKKGR